MSNPSEQLLVPNAEDVTNTISQNSVEAPFPIVGVAASAGGLEAFSQLLSQMPTDTGMAFVLIQHLSPDHESLLTEILARETRLSVHEVKNDMRVEPNHVYVIPPNTKMIIAEGLLKLSPREKVSGKYMPGDAFFISLAADRGHKAIAVVLSGGDGDGSLGLKAIKAVGGVTFAQCENTAKFESMPNTAIATGDVDFVLPPEKIAEELASLSRSPKLTSPLPQILPQAPPQPGDALAIIFALLRSATGVDFSHYKTNTLDRRIQRRMLLYKLEQLDDYAEYLQAHPEEVQALYQEILIHVTSFFRDPEAFELLKEQVFPIIGQNKSAEIPIRIWVAGCSTGEEVYSIAICLLEFLADKPTQPVIQIFATDISEQAIDKARAGIYQENQMVDVSPERRRRYFYTLENDRYQINKTVRELCVFARQNLGGDPPFSNLDLVSCRNVLIYLDESLQKRIMPIFHYSLKSTGFMMLGTSETPGQYADLFTVIDKKYRIYAKKPSEARSIFSFTPSNYPIARVSDRQLANQVSTEEFDLQKKVDQLIANHYAPICVVIDDQMQVLQLRGEIDRYLKLVPGVANLNLFNLVRTGLLYELRAAIYQAQHQLIPIIKNGLRLEEGGQSRVVNLQVMPFPLPTAEKRHFLVLFEEAPAIARSLDSANLDGSQGDLEQEIVRLKQELAAAIQGRAATQDYLQTVIQEQENSNQDIKIANEEILSSNEELQSTNEELETAKEEIQATNEELNTVNEELRSRNLELQNLNNDLTNLLASINIPILMLTEDLRIRRFTPLAQQLFNFIAADTGRPLSDIRANLNIPDLETLILEVQQTLSVKELEVQTQQGYWYMLRIRPYRTIENQIDGVILMLVDIDVLKRSATSIEAARNYAEAIVETVQMPLIVVESDFRVSKVNHSFYETFQVSPSKVVPSLIFDLDNGEWNIPELRSLLEDVLANDTTLQNIEIEHRFTHIGQKTMLLNACKITQDGAAQRILLTIEDITAHKQFETERSQLLTQEQSARQQAESANLAKDEFLSNLSHELRNPLNTMMGWAQILRTRQPDAATVNRALETMELSARAQSQLIEDLLDISRIASGKLHLKTRLLDLVPIVNVVIDSVHLATEAKSIQIFTDLTSTMTIGDSDRLQQVLWNLLINAIKFTPTGGQIEIRVEPVGTHAELRVRDTGQGIRAELLPHIFERFRQGDSSTTKSKQGLGLGLSIVRHVVELHGGTVRAESPGEEQGATFIVQLPLHSMPVKVIPPDLESIEESVAEATSQAVLSLEGLHILAVDDAVDSLDMMRWTLENVGAEVITATSAKDAIAALMASPGRYDVLLADIGMPGEDGLALIRQVRSLDAEVGGQIPAAAITAYVSDQERQLALDTGFQVHMAKPINPTQLVLVVANLVGRGGNE